MARRGSTISIPGLIQAQKQLRNSTAYIREPMEFALDDAARVILSEVEATAPKDKTGNFRRSLRKALGRAKATFLHAYVFALSRIAPHAHLLEYGTKPHKIRAKDGKAMFIWNSSLGRELGFVTEVDHPGARPQKIFRNAVARKRREVRKILTSGLNRAIERLNAQAA